MRKTYILVARCICVSNFAWSGNCTLDCKTKYTRLR